MPKIAGMSLVAERPYTKYGSAVLIREDLKVENVYEKVQRTVELITIVMSRVVVHSVYKPPNDQFALLALGHGDLPHIVIGYFNSHSTTWGYDTTDSESILNGTIKSVISGPIKDFIHHYPRALFNDIPRVGVHFYDIPGSRRTFTTYLGRGAV